MDFLTLAKERCSVRKFRPDAVPKEDILKILEAGRVAPTACNNQPQRILAITGDDARARLKKCTACHFDAPLAFLICADTAVCWRRSFDGKTSEEVDAAIVTTHMMLEAASLGIGSTWVMFFDPEAARAEFALPETVVPVAMLMMGYPAEGYQPSERHEMRKPLSETVTFE